MKKFLNSFLVCCFTLLSFSIAAQQVANSTIVFLQNVGTGEYLTSNTVGGTNPPALMSASAGPVETQWTFELNTNGRHNIDSQVPSTTNGRGILRALGTGIVISTNRAPARNDSDKSWTIEYDAANDTYRFLQQNGNNRYLYDNPNGSVTATNVPATDLNSVWKAIIAFPPPPPSVTPTITLQNCGTGEFLTAAVSGSNVTMSASAGPFDTPTHWAFEPNTLGLNNIDSQLPGNISGRGILRVLGSGSVISTNIMPGTNNSNTNDKSWTIEYDAINDSYRFRQGANRYLYVNPDGSVTATNVPATDLNSSWKVVSPFAKVPTMSEWGIFILFLLMITVTLVLQMAPKMATTNGQTVYTGINFGNIPFDKITFLKAWSLTIVFAIVVFTTAMNFFGYELTSADPIGSIVASGIIAYLFMLLKKQR